MPLLASSCSRQSNTYSLLTGEPSGEPDILASFQVGANGAEGGAPEYTISNGAPQSVRHGRLIWDAAHERDSAAPFFSVAPVRLDVDAKGCRLAVGTSAFISAPTHAARGIDKVQIVAHTGNHTPDRIVRWDWIEVTFIDADGRREVLRSPCLPAVGGAQPARRSAIGVRAPAETPKTQFAEICAGEDVVAVSVRGQITLRANDGSQPRSLEPEDLQGRIRVFANH